MKMIWVLEDGDYSDYHVIGVFSTKENAELVKSKVGGELREWVLDPAIDAINKGLSVYTVLMLRDGTTESIREQEIGQYSMVENVWLWQRSKAPAYAGTGVQDVLNATVLAKDKKHAVKITNEHRTRFIAENKWSI